MKEKFIEKLIKTRDIEEYSIECEESIAIELIEYFNQFKEWYDINEIKKIVIPIYSSKGNTQKFYYMICLSNKQDKHQFWNNYFYNLADIFNQYKIDKTNIRNIWLINIDNDFLNNHHLVYIGIEMKE